MKPEALKNGQIVVHVKHDRLYVVVECNMRMKDSVNGWVDAVIYKPLYDNEYACFAREKQSFLDEFEIAGIRTYID
jgi:hypothetical protein